MSQDSVSMLRRSHSTSRAAVDPYDQAEQGFEADPAGFNGSRLPVKARKTLSLRYSLHSSDSTLAAVSKASFKTDAQARAGTPHPRQEASPRPPTWPSRCINRIQCSPSSQSSPFNSSAERPDGFQQGYAQFQYKSFEQYPDGWPRVAAFMESCDSYSIYRKFGHCHARLLAIHMTNITEMEAKLFGLDRDDELGGKATDWRLKNRYHDKGLDTTKRDLEARLEKEILAYDNLLLQFGALKALNKTPLRNHDSLFKWLWKNKPLDDHEFDWIFHPEDFVSLVPPRRNRVENFILRNLDGGSNTAFKSFFKTGKQQHQSKDTAVGFYCTARISMSARLVVVFFAVLVLFIPVILFLLTSMSRGCMAIVVLAFVFIFSVMVSLLTDAGDKEVFVGTATYCAVLVTFLGNLQRNGN